MNTKDKRRKYPERYLRKDARTRVYAALYGPANNAGVHAGNDPTIAEGRRLPFYWEWETASAEFRGNIDAAQFSPARRAMLEAKLEGLKHAKPKGG